MSISWSEMKQRVENQMGIDPQRATLNERAIAGVEDGLRHLASTGYNFEIAPRGTLAELIEVRGEPEPVSNPLSIKDGAGHLAAPKVEPDNSFEAKSTN